MNLPWLNNSLFDLAGHHISLLGVAGFLGLLLLGLIVARFLQSSLVRRALNRLKLDTNLVAVITTILSVAAFVFFAVSAVNALGIPLAWSAPLPGVAISLLQIFLLVGLLLLVFWISSRTKRFLFNRFLVHSGLDRSLQYAIAQITANVVLVVGVLVVLQNTGIHLEALTVFAGAVGVGIGFGLQNITSNFISGLVILAERPIAIGDRVEVAGITGQVKQIRARSTVVVTNDNIATIVPNQKFIDSPVTNWTYGDPKVRFRIPIGVAYGSDVELVRQKLVEAAQDDSHTLRDPAPSVFFVGFGDSSLNFELVAWSDEMSHRPRRYRSDLNFAIEKKLREAGIEIPLPQREIRVRGDGLTLSRCLNRDPQIGRESGPGDDAGA